MAFLDDPKKRNAAGAIAAGLVVAGAVWYFIYTPGQEALVGQQARLESLEASNRQAQLTYARGGGSVEEQLALYERHVMQLEQLIPGSEEVAGLINSITREARQSNVELVNVEPEGTQPGTFYVRDSYRLGAIGEYHDVARFLTAIASLPRIITPVELELQRYNSPAQFPEMDQPVQAQFRIETYVLPEDQGPPPAEMGGEGGGQ